MKYEPHKEVAPVVVKATAAANTDVVVTIAADADEKWDITGIIFSYDADPSAAKPNITVDVGGVEKVSNFVTASGLGFLPIREMGGIPTDKNQAVVITLEAGGASVIGKLTVFYR